MWRLTQVRHDNRVGGEPEPRVCQLISALYENDVLVLDLVPLQQQQEAAGSTPMVSTPMVPITIRVGTDLCSSLVATWAADADIVTLRHGRTHGTDWLCLSNDDCHLVLGLPGTTA